MKSDCDGLAELRARLLELKRQNLRLKRLGLIGLIGVAMLIVLGQTPSKKIVEANEFILKDNSGKVRARTTMNSLGDPEMILFNEKGKEPVKLTGSIGGSRPILAASFLSSMDKAKSARFCRRPTLGFLFAFIAASLSAASVSATRHSPRHTSVQVGMDTQHRGADGLLPRP